MKKILIALSLFFYMNCQAQSKKSPDWTKLSSAECLDLVIEPLTSLSTELFPFSNIEITDMRFDKKVSGYYYSSFYKSFRQICVSESIPKQINDLLRNYFAFGTGTPGQSNTLYLQLKKFWICNTDGFKKSYSLRNTHYTIDLELDFFLKQKDCYYPLYKFDSTMTMEGDWKKVPKLLVATAIKASIQKLSRLGSFDLRRLNCLSILQVDSFNKTTSVSNIPALQHEVASKGVYLTFDEFINNRPSFFDFDVNMNDGYDDIIVKGKSQQDSTIIDAWGFSDGTKMFIRLRHNFFQLIRIGDHFEFYGFANILFKRSFSQSSNEIYNSNTPQTNLAQGLTRLLESIPQRIKLSDLYFLDIRTGRVY